MTNDIINIHSDNNWNIAVIKYSPINKKNIENGNYKVWYCIINIIDYVILYLVL